MSSELLELYQTYTNEEIFRILVLRDQYTEQAVELATGIAIERGIITDETDLPAIEKKSTKGLSGLFTPNNDTKKQVEQRLKGIQRFILFIGIGYAGIYLLSSKTLCNPWIGLFAILSAGNILAALLLKVIPRPFILFLMALMLLGSLTAFFPAWLVSRTELFLQSFLFLLSAWFYLQYVQTPTITQKKS